MKDQFGRRYWPSVTQRIFGAVVMAMVAPILLIGLLVFPPPKRWGDPRYKW